MIVELPLRFRLIFIDHSARPKNIAGRISQLGVFFLIIGVFMLKPEKTWTFDVEICTIVLHKL